MERDQQTISFEQIYKSVTEWQERHVRRAEAECVCRPTDAPRLLRDMRAYDCAFLVRHLLACLGMDEQLAFRFRVDHKLVQCRLLRSFAPDAFPEALGFSEAYLSAETTNFRPWLEARFPMGFVLKNVYGYASGRTTVLNSHLTIEQRLGAGLHLPARTPLEEEIFFQERIDAVREYRVHTLGRDAIRTLTFRTHGSKMPLGELERLEINDFVEGVAKLLPAPLIEHSLCAWDVGLKSSGQYVVFEINYTGRHPVFEPGFHCSAYLQSDIDNTLNMARLVQHIELKDKMRVRFDFSEQPTNPLEMEALSTLYQVSSWRKLLSIADEITSLWEESYRLRIITTSSSEDVGSIREQIFANQSGPTEREYCEYLDWLKRAMQPLL